MNEPIISPWIIYWITRLDNIKETLNFIGFISFVIALLGMTTMLVNCSQEFRSEQKWFCIGARIFKLAITILCVSVPLNIFIPNSKVAIAMYMSNSITPENIQNVAEVLDKAADKLTDKIIKIKEAQ